jgi:HK97 family phage major capsid protein
MTTKTTTVKKPAQHRRIDFKIESQRTAEDGRPIISIAASSEFPVARPDGYEILDHSANAVDLTRFKAGLGPFCVNHNTDDQVGVIENPTIGADRVLRADIRFSKSQRGQEIMTDVLDGTRKGISIGYWVRRIEIDANDNGDNTYLVTSWEPFEISTVPVPADITVGVGRSTEEVRDCEVVTKNEPVTQQEEVQPTEVDASAQVEAPKLVAATEGERSMATSTTNLDENMKDNNETETKPNASVGEDQTAKARKEAQDIAQLAFEHGFADKTSEWLAAGRSLASVQTEILRMKSNKPSATPTTANDVANAMSRKEIKEYSLTRAARALAAGDRSGFEFEMSDSIARALGKTAQGFFYPTQEAVLRTALDSTTATAAKELVFQNYAGFVDMLRPNNVALQLGASFNGGVVGNYTFARQTGGAAASWVAENGAGVSQTNPTFDNIVLAGKTVMVTVGITRQLQQKAIVDGEAKARQDMIKNIALMLDKAALAGSGSANEPIGILNAAGVNVARSVTSGSNISFAACVAMETKVGEANALNGKLAYAFTPGVMGNLKTTLQAPASSSALGFILGPDGKVNTYQTAVANNLPQNLVKDSVTGIHGAIFGDWSQLEIVDWGAVDLMVDPYSQKNKAIIELTGYYLCDVALFQPTAFSVLKDIIKF